MWDLIGSFVPGQPGARLLFAIVLVVLLGLLLSTSWRGRRAARARNHIAIAGLDKFPVPVVWASRVGRAVKLALLVVMLGLTAFLWGELASTTLGAGTMAGNVDPLRTVLAVYDISSSMAAPFGNQQVGSRHVVARDALADFLEEQDQTQVGLIFFSSEVLEYRRPTRDVPQLVRDLRGLDIAPAAGQQLADLSLGTETARALNRAAAVMESLALSNARSGVVILVSDLLDDKARISRALENLTDANTRVYVLSIEGRGVESSALVADALALNPGVRSFHIRTPDDMREVYEAITAIERAARERGDMMTEREQSTRRAVVVLFIAIVAFAVSSEVLLPKLRRGRSDALAR